MDFEVFIEQSDEGVYVAYIPELPGCICDGDTIEEALDNIMEVVDLYLEPVEDEMFFDEEMFDDEMMDEGVDGWGYNA